MPASGAAQALSTCCDECFGVADVRMLAGEPGSGARSARLKSPSERGLMLTCGQTDRVISSAATVKTLRSPFAEAERFWRCAATTQRQSSVAYAMKEEENRDRRLFRQHATRRRIAMQRLCGNDRADRGVNQQLPALVKLLALMFDARKAASRRAVGVLRVINGVIAEVLSCGKIPFCWRRRPGELRLAGVGDAVRARHVRGAFDDRLTPLAAEILLPPARQKADNVSLNQRAA